MRRAWFALVITSCSGSIGLGQDDLALSQLRGVPQHALQLPGSRPQVGGFVGMPALSSIHFQGQNDWFHPGKWFTLENGHGVFDPEAFQSSLSSSNAIGIQESLELISFGFSTGDRRNFWSFSAVQRMELGFALPEDLLRLPWMGNLNGEGPGGRVDLSGFNAAYQQRLEASMFWHRQWNPRWSSGLSVKGIAGIQHVGLSDVEAIWDTDSIDYAWTFRGAGVLETSHVASLMDDEAGENVEDIFSWKGLNPGWGIQAGVTREGEGGSSTSLHLVDVGQVFWKSGVRNWQLGPGEITFDGLQLGEILDEADLSQDSLAAWSEAFLEEARQTGNLTENRRKFTTHLPWKFRIQHRQPLYSTEKVLGGVSVQLQVAPSSGLPGRRSFLGVAWFHERGRNAVSCAASVDQSGAFSAGAAWSLHLGPIQWYASVDNLLAARLVAFEWQSDGEESPVTLLFPYHAPYIQLHTGIQWIFGRKEQMTRSGDS